MEDIPEDIPKILLNKTEHILKVQLNMWIKTSTNELKTHGNIIISNTDKIGAVVIQYINDHIQEAKQ